MASKRADGRRASALKGASDVGSEARGSAVARVPVELPAPHAIGVFLAFVLLGLAIYQPALGGSFFSDDRHYVSENRYIQEPSVDHLLAIWDPTSVVAQLVENYAPVHLMLHGIEWQLFGREVTGYHVVNVVLHALAAALLVAVFLRSGIPRAAAIAAGAFFLVHPANVEAVAWIAQIKTPAAMVMMLGALLLHPRRPAFALICFALALLTKPTAAVALPVAIAWGWTHIRSEGSDRPAWRWGWLAAWGAAFAVFSVAEFAAFFDTAGLAPPIYPELDVRLRSVCAIGLRYLLMAVSGTGLSLFHETPAAASWLDPWWLTSLVAIVAVAWRSIFALVHALPELAYWVWAVVSFAAISGVVPLPFPMADRYLYFILPGLLGAAMLSLQPLGLRLAARLEAQGRARALLPAGLVVLLVAMFGVLAHARAGIWTTPDRLMADAELHYPDGAAARTRRATRAARAGDMDTAVEHLSVAVARGYNRLDHLLNEPAYRAHHEHPGFRAILDGLARDFVRRFESRVDPSQVELRVLGQALVVLGETDRAEEALVRALEVGGPFDRETRTDLEALRRMRRIAADAERRRARREARGASPPPAP